MSPKRKAKEPPASISISGGVKGIGNVIGNESQSNVSVSTAQESSSSTRKSKIPLLWVRLLSFLATLAGSLLLIGLFVRLLEGFDAALIVEFALAGLVCALGISGVLKPQLLADLFGKLIGRK